MTGDLISKKEAATMLQCTPRTVMNKAKADPKFPQPFKLGDGQQDRIKFSRLELQAWIDSRRGARL